MATPVTGDLDLGPAAVVAIGGELDLAGAAALEREPARQVSGAA